jgi:hypothetical protein
MENIDKKEQAKRGRKFRKKAEEADPHGSGKNHPFGSVHPLTEGQEKIIKQVSDMMFGKRELGIKVSIENNRYFNWKDCVWSCAVGIVIGVIIANL